MEEINASPTKEFFINMLTRDVVLDKAILDLIDNSVDAAHTMNKISECIIDVVIEGNQFVISDNCGGIDKEIAKNYAFRFGRSNESPITPDSVGQFGVGMKRTLFKMGREFEVKSITKTDSFCVNVNVSDWMSPDTDWTFQLETLEASESDLGTYIKVSSIYEGVSEQFELDSFVRDVISEIGKAHFRAISEGLSIKVNGELVTSSELAIINTPLLSSIGKELEIDGVIIKIIAGISTREYHEGGWYVVCNGRLIESAETSSVTGWGIDGIRRYHPDFAYFRGLIEMNASDSSKLPWTTTKSGIDIDNPIYRRVLNEIKVLMRQVNAFLSERAKEDKEFKDEKITERPLNEAIEEAVYTDIYKITEFSDNLIRPHKTQAINPNPVTTIQYKVLMEKMDVVKGVLGMEYNKDVGLETFNYYYDEECSDE